MKKLSRFFLLSLTLVLAGCGEYIAIAGITAGSAYLGYQHSKYGGLQYRFTNFYVEANIHALWKEAKIDEPFLDVVAVYGIPVVIGAALNKESLEKAKALAFMKSDKIYSLVEGVKPGAWNTNLAVKIKTKLIFDLDISARNYYVAAIKDQLFIVGVAESEYEKRALIDRVTNMDGVKVLKHHIIVLDEEQRALEDGYVVREK